jgi:hypothetical protein
MAVGENVGVGTIGVVAGIIGIGDGMAVGTAATVGN